MEAELGPERFPAACFKFHCTVGCLLVAISLTQKYDIHWLALKLPIPLLAFLTPVFIMDPSIYTHCQYQSLQTSSKEIPTWTDLCAVKAVLQLKSHQPWNEEQVPITYQLCDLSRFFYLSAWITPSTTYRYHHPLQGYHKDERWFVYVKCLTVFWLY